MDKRKFGKWEAQLHRVHFADWAMAMTRQEFALLVDTALEEGVDIGTSPDTAKRRYNCQGCAMRVLRAVAGAYYAEAEATPAPMKRKKGVKRIDTPVKDFDMAGEKSADS